MASSRAQQAAIAISMKKAGKKPKTLPKAQNGVIMIGPGYSMPSPRPMSRRKFRLDPGFIKNNPNSISNRLKEKGIQLDSGFDMQQKPKGNYKLDPGFDVRPKSKGKAYKKGGSTPAWTRKEGKNPTGGLNAKGVASYRAANPGSKLQTAVTTKPSKIKAGSKDAKRRKSFCSRMEGMKKKLTSAKTARDPNSRINKSLRKWNC